MPLHFDLKIALICSIHSWYGDPMNDMVIFECDVKNRTIDAGNCPAGVILRVTSMTSESLLDKMGFYNTNPFLITYNNMHTHKTDVVFVTADVAERCSPFLSILALHDVDFDMFLGMIDL